MEKNYNSFRTRSPSDVDPREDYHHHPMIEHVRDQRREILQETYSSKPSVVIDLIIRPIRKLFYWGKE